MVIAMALMGMMQMTFHQIIGVASMRNRFMSGTSAMGVSGVVFAACMIRGASRRIRTTFVEGVFVYMALVDTVEMSLAQIIDMTLVPDPPVCPQPEPCVCECCSCVLWSFIFTLSRCNVGLLRNAGPAHRCSGCFATDGNFGRITNSVELWCC
jgi:hypothetical protein